MPSHWKSIVCSDIVTHLISIEPIGMSMHILAVFEHHDIGTMPPMNQAIEHVEIGVAEMLLLDLPTTSDDPRWSARHVQAVEAHLSSRRMQLIGHIRERVMAQAKCNEWSPKMDALFRHHCEMSTELSLMDRILPILRRVDSEIHAVWLFAVDATLLNGKSPS